MPFKFRSVHDHYHRRRAELILAFQDQTSGGEQGEGLAGALGMPDESALFRRLGAALDDAVHGSALVLAQHGLLRLAVFNVEQDPVAQCAQEIGRLEKRLDGEAVAFFRPLLPTRHGPARYVPSDAIPIVEKVSNVEELRRPHQLWRFLLVAFQLSDAPLDSVGVFWVLMLDDGDRHAVDDEHHVRTVALARWRLELPFPSDVKNVVAGRIEVDELDGSGSLFGFVVPLSLPAQPSEHLAVALNRRWDRFKSFDDGADGIVCHPRIESPECSFKLIAEQHPGFAAALLQGAIGRDGCPADFGRVADHGELDGASFGDVEFSHELILSLEALG